MNCYQKYYALTNSGHLSILASRLRVRLV